MLRTRTLLAPAAALVVALGLAGCDAVAPMPTPTPSPTYDVTGDGVLTIGTLLDSSWAGAPAAVAGVEVAVREINEAGGVDGVPVVVHHRNAGQDAASAETAFADLVALGADVVIGPSSVDAAEALLAPAVEAGVPLISPALATPDFAAIDDSGYLFRTIAAQSAQGAAVARVLLDAGTADVAYFSLGDDYGTSVLSSLEDALGKKGSVVYVGEASASTTDFGTDVRAAKKKKPTAVVVAFPLGSGEQVAELLAELEGAGYTGDQIVLAAGSASDYTELLDPGVLDGAVGVREGRALDEDFAARVRRADPGLGSLAFAAQAYDATILAALAVTRVGDDGGPAIARTLREVSATGSQCTSYGACLSVLATEPDIDYVGVSGPVDLSKNGNATRAWFTPVAYDGTNAPVAGEPFLVG